VDGREGARARALLGLGVARARRALGAREDAALREDEDVAVRELLLKLAGEALLDAVEALQGRDGDKDDNSLLAVADLDLAINNQHASSRTSLGPLPVLFHVSEFSPGAAGRRWREEGGWWGSREAREGAAPASSIMARDAPFCSPLPQPFSLPPDAPRSIHHFRCGSEARRKQLSRPAIIAAIIIISPRGPRQTAAGAAGP
jgi:hypothetical protein